MVLRTDVICYRLCAQTTFLKPMHASNRDNVILTNFGAPVIREKLDCDLIGQLSIQSSSVHHPIHQN